MGSTSKLIKTLLGLEHNIVEHGGGSAARHADDAHFKPDPAGSGLVVPNGEAAARSTDLKAQLAEKDALIDRQRELMRAQAERRAAEDAARQRAEEAAARDRTHQAERERMQRQHADELRARDEQAAREAQERAAKEAAAARVTPRDDLRHPGTGKMNEADKLAYNRRNLDHLAEHTSRQGDKVDHVNLTQAQAQFTEGLRANGQVVVQRDRFLGILPRHEMTHPRAIEHRIRSGQDVTEGELGRLTEFQHRRLAAGPGVKEEELLRQHEVIHAPTGKLRQVLGINAIQRAWSNLTNSSPAPRLRESPSPRVAAAALATVAAIGVGDITHDYLDKDVTTIGFTGQGLDALTGWAVDVDGKGALSDGVGAYRYNFMMRHITKDEKLKDHFAKNVDRADPGLNSMYQTLLAAPVGRDNKIAAQATASAGKSAAETQAGIIKEQAQAAESAFGGLTGIKPASPTADTRNTVQREADRKIIEQFAAPEPSRN